MDTKAVVLLSGGVDSSTCLGIAVEQYGVENVKALCVHYGQRHSIEEDCAMKIAEYYGVTLSQIDISSVMQFSNCSLMAHSDEDVPTSSYAEQIEANGDGRVSTYVPFRNGLMLSVAAAFADSVFPGDKVAIVYGAHSDDAAGNAYADCSQEFADSMAAAINIGTYGNVGLVAPLLNMNKVQVVAAGLALPKPVPYNMTHSCYNGVQGGCGECATCIDRRIAFESNGLSIL